MMLKGKKILIGITGSIAAYKAAHLVRLCVKNGAEVRVILTPNAQGFVTPLTLSTLSKNPVYSELFNADTGEWANHVDLGLWADLMVIAPLSASTLAKMATAQSDNLLLTTYLSARCPVMVAPAMDLDMYKHPEVVRNLDTLKGNGNLIIPAEKGELASGLEGEGRMAEPEHILDYIVQFFEEKLTWKGRTYIITSGPTYEPIDPVRFIGNRSSGKMGVALAEVLAEKGAQVILVSGPSNIKTSHPRIHRIDVETGKQMFEAVQTHFNKVNGIICAAAVADYTVENPATQKLKKEEGTPEIKLVKNPDILKWCGENKTLSQIVIGFALETNDEELNALKKLENKKADAIVLNSLNNPGAGFNADTNKITIFDRSGKKIDFETESKNKIAEHIVNTLENWFYNV
ncbi:MAG TPA: bifunctional phosphopantothenoylcysteine decarboxylase/phosphopantothenate--cysteine ligase CoaBC [Bacteroidia bacterium]